MEYVFALGLIAGYWLAGKAQKSQDSRRVAFIINSIRLILNDQNQNQSAKLESINNLVNQQPNSIGQAYQQFVPNNQISGNNQQLDRPQQQPMHQTQPVQSQVNPQLLQQRKQLNKTEQLLYFGVFLFVTSVGLFMAFADLSGTARTLSVALIAATIYSLGLYIYNNVKKLKQVGEAFVGIGMIIAPFVGVAAYQFMFNQSNAELVWLVTSLITLVIYLSTIRLMQSAFTAYLLIGSTVSTSLSFAGLADGPVYVYIWMIIFAGLAVQLTTHLLKGNEPLEEAASELNVLFAPLAIALSLLSLINDGFFQFGVTLLLASGYYLIQSLADKANSVKYYAASHALVISGLGSLLFSATEDFDNIGLYLVTVVAAHTIFNFVSPKKLHILIENNAVIAAGLMLLFSLGNPYLQLASLLIFIISSVSHSIAYKDETGFMVASFAWTAIGFVIGQLLLEPALGIDQQVALVSLFALSLVFVLAVFNKNALKKYRLVQANTTLLIVMLVNIFAFIASSTLFLALAMVWFVACVFARLKLKDSKWTVLGFVWLYSPIAYALFSYNDLFFSWYLTATVLLALAVSVAAALILRSSWLRWASTILWLFLPLAWRDDELALHKEGLWYFVGAYALVAFVLAVSRAIALGRISLVKKYRCLA